VGAADLVSIDLKELVEGVERVYRKACGCAPLASASATAPLASVSATAATASTQQGPHRERRHVA
jgi:hypothetical protein